MRNLVLLVTLAILAPTISFAGLKISSYNIRNFDYDQRARIQTDTNFLYDTISQINPDFMAVQEIRETEKFERFITSKFHKRYAVALTECGGAHDQRLGFIFDKSKFQLISFSQDLRTVNPGKVQTIGCGQGSRPLAVGKFRVKETGATMVAISVHLKSGGRPKSIQKRFKQLSILAKVVNEHRAQGYENFVIMGDFNSTEYIYKGQEYNKFKMHVERMGMVDLAADLPCTAYWWGGIDDGKQHPSMLDHMLVSNEFLMTNSITQVQSEVSTKKAQATTHCQNLRCNSAWEDGLGRSFDSVSDHCPLQSEI